MVHRKHHSRLKTDANVKAVTFVHAAASVVIRNLRFASFREFTQKKNSSFLEVLNSQWINKIWIKLHPPWLLDAQARFELLAWRMPTTVASLRRCWHSSWLFATPLHPNCYSLTIAIQGAFSHRTYHALHVARSWDGHLSLAFTLSYFPNGDAMSRYVSFKIEYKKKMPNGMLETRPCALVHFRDEKGCAGGPALSFIE